MQVRPLPWALFSGLRRGGSTQAVECYDLRAHCGRRPRDTWLSYRTAFGTFAFVMIENWVDFALNVVGGATAFLCLFDGTRRLCAFGAHRKAVIMTVLAAGICALYGGFAYWKYTDLKATLSMNQRKPASTQLPANWRGGLSPERKEILSLARARQSFVESGTLGSYIDRGGETRTFAPTQEDLMRRERVVAYYSRAEYAARSSLAEALLWLIIGVVAILFGFAMSFEKLPAQAGPTAAPGAPSDGRQISR